MYIAAQRKCSTEKTKNKFFFIDFFFFFVLMISLNALDTNGETFSFFCSFFSCLWGNSFFGEVFNVIFTGIKYFGDNIHEPPVSIRSHMKFIFLFIDWSSAFPLDTTHSQTHTVPIVCESSILLLSQNSTKREKNIIQFVYMASPFSMDPSSNS